MAHYQEKNLPHTEQCQKLANLFEQATSRASETSTSAGNNVPFNPGTKRQSVNAVTSREMSALQQHNESRPSCFQHRAQFPSRQTGHISGQAVERSVSHQFIPDLHTMTDGQFKRQDESHLHKHPLKTTLPAGKKRTGRRNTDQFEGTAAMDNEKSLSHQFTQDLHATEERFNKEEKCQSSSSTKIINVDLPRVFYDYGKKLDDWKDVARPALPPDVRKTVEYSGRALEIGRPLNKLMVMLVGECGSGKSTTLRKVFLAGNINTIETKTTIVTEYVKELSVYDESSKIKGKLSFVDVPGFAHNDQSINNRQLADIVYFREQNTDIAKRQRGCKGKKCVYPNIVLFTIKANDSLLRREKGELLSSLKSLQRCCIVDQHVVNIIIVVTHASFLEKEAKKSTKRMICQTISEAVYEILAIRHVKILFVENKANINCQNQNSTNFCISNYLLTKSVLDQLKANHDHLGFLFWEWYFDGSERHGEPSVLYHMSAVDLPHSIQDFHSMVKSSHIHPTKMKKVILYSKTALETGRPLNKVMIVMAGQSGTGKSETINVLFNEKICKTSTNTSETRKVIEVGKELCVKAESPPVKGILSFVDVPGSNDVDRSKEALNQAIVRKFRDENAGLTSRRGFFNDLFAVRENVYPNAVLLVVKATDNRIVGPNSTFQQSLKLLQTNGIVDPLHANLIIVVTHAMSIPYKRYRQTCKEQLDIFQETVVNVLGIHDVPVVFVENCAEAHVVEKENGCNFYQLPDGELSHYNLIQVLIAVFRQNNDLLGRLFCGWYFSDECPEKMKPVDVIESIGHETVTTSYVKSAVEKVQSVIGYFHNSANETANAVTPKDHEIFNNNETKAPQEALHKSDVLIPVTGVASTIKHKSHKTLNHEEKKVYDGVVGVITFLGNKTKAAIETLTTRHETVNNNKVNPVVTSLQKVKSDLQTNVVAAASPITTTGRETVNVNEIKSPIETPQFQFQYLGYGYCPKTETMKHVSLCPRKEMKHVCIINKTYSVPMEVQVTPQKETYFQFRTEETKKGYEESRVIGYGIGTDIKLIVNVDSHGRWIKDSVSNNAEICLSSLYEVRCAKFVLDEPETSTKLNILEAIDHLPYYTKECSEPFKEFFKKWGTHFITEVYIGGCIKVDSLVKVNTYTQKLGTEILNKVQLAFKGFWVPGNLSGEYKNTHATQQHQDILNEQITVCGGDQPLFFFKKLEEISPELVSTWQETVKAEPTELKYSFKLKPYYNLVKGEQRTNLENATLDFLNDDWQDKILKNALQANKEVRRDDVSSVITDEVIDDVKEEVKNGSSCFPSSAKVYTKDGFTSINSFKHGDEVLTVHKRTVSSKSMQLGTTEICTYLHFDPHVKAEFLVFHLQDGKILTVTGEHLLFSYDDGHLKLVSANKIAIGSTLACLNAVDNSNPLGVLEPISVIAISKTILQGVFSPLTLDGTCIVDGVFVSCYACVDSHSVAHASMAPLRWWYNARKALTCLLDTITSVLKTPVASSISQWVQNDVCILGIHTYAKLLMSLNHSLPFSFLQQHRND